TTDEYREALAVVRRNAEQLARTVDALVAAARHEAGSVRGTADAYEVARETVDACAVLAEERRGQVELTRPATPVRIGIDADLAARILQPVVENACRYGRTSVRVEVARADEAVVFEVADDGAGVSDEEREHIFEPGGRGRAGSRNGHDCASLE